VPVTALRAMPGTPQKKGLSKTAESLVSLVAGPTRLELATSGVTVHKVTLPQPPCPSLFYHVKHTHTTGALLTPLYLDIYIFMPYYALQGGNRGGKLIGGSTYVFTNRTHKNRIPGSLL
jgi:hypothetical protein